MTERYRHFDPGARFWTPDWDFTHSQHRTVKAVRKRNGSWHLFEGLVSEAEADLAHPAPRRGPSRPGESRQVRRARERREAARG